MSHGASPASPSSTRRRKARPWLAAALLAWAAGPAAAATVEVVQSFDEALCSLPHGSLLRTADGTLYGTCHSGGTGWAGILYRFTPGAPGAGFSVLRQFSYQNSADSANPGPGLLLGLDGRLWGSADGGGPTESDGTIFSLNTDGSGFVLQASLFYDTTGLIPSPLVQDASGAVYGTANQGGGKRARGTLFRYDSATGLSTLVTFRARLDAGFPKGAPTLGPDGLLYGVAQSGFSAEGKPDDGTLYRVRTDGTGYQRLLAFDGPINGFGPTGKLLLASDGHFYGVTVRGGAHDRGLVYRWTMAGQFTVLHDFVGTDGGWPVGGVVQGADGALYGVTNQGGSGGNENIGTVYRVTLDGQFSSLHSFDTTSPAGYYPNDLLTPAPDGSLYGANWRGPNGGPGTVFRIVP